MAKKKTKPEGEQMDLIDVGPENAGPMVEVARKYKDVVTKRCKLTAKEVALKVELREMVRAAGLHPLKDGVIRFEHDGVTITVTPQDEKIQVKDANEG